jgi:7-carboxy-7-deazaguanine synthase
MTYIVKEIFYTLQGEGANAGRAAVFCRFAGCNLWSGREQDRAGAICTFCDTDFVGVGPDGGKFADADALADAIEVAWCGDAAGKSHRFVVCTGGEPMLQIDEDLTDALHRRGFRIAVETNGTLPILRSIDWVCVSPKASTTLAVTRGDELKLVYPQETAMPERFNDLEFTHFFLQPMDGPALAAATRSAIRYCLQHPQWRLSVQTHKVAGIR